MLAGVRCWACGFIVCTKCHGNLSERHLSIWYTAYRGGIYTSLIGTFCDTSGWQRTLQKDRQGYSRNEEQPEG